jgi:hypothetical protein
VPIAALVRINFGWTLTDEIMQELDSLHLSSGKEEGTMRRTMMVLSAAWSCYDCQTPDMA